MRCQNGNLDLKPYMPYAQSMYGREQPPPFQTVRSHECKTIIPLKFIIMCFEQDKKTLHSRHSMCDVSPLDQICMDFK